jgi:hypothetical protein
MFNMYKVTFDIEGVTPIVFSKYLDKTNGEAAPKKGENDKSPEYENRISHLKAHVDDKGIMFIPACALADCICAMAKKAGDKKKGLQTWAKTFDTGIESEENLSLGVHINKSERHSGFFRVSKEKDTRIYKSFPMVSNWKCKASLLVEDDSIPVDKIKEYAELAGRRIGLGSFRKQNKGMMGKFLVKNFKTSNIK